MLKEIGSLIRRSNIDKTEFDRTDAFYYVHTAWHCFYFEPLFVQVEDDLKLKDVDQ